MFALAVLAVAAAVVSYSAQSSIRAVRHKPASRSCERPGTHLNALLNTYRDAGTASAKATAKTAETHTLGRGKHRSRIAAPISRSAHRHTTVTMISDGEEEQKMPGPVERILCELGVTDQTLLNRGQALDDATSQLVAEAAQQTAPQRCNQTSDHVT